MFICAFNQVKASPTDWQSTCSCWCICCSWEVSSTSTSATRIQWGRARTQVQGSVRSRWRQRRIRLIGRTGSTDVRQPRELSRLVRVQLPGTGSTRWASNVRCEFCYDLWYWHCSVVCSQWIKLLKSTVILHTFSLKANIKLNLSHFLNKFLCILWWYLVIFGLHTHTRLTALFLWLPRWAGTSKVKTNLDFTEARDSEWQWHQLAHMQVCTSLHTDNHTSTPVVCFLVILGLYRIIIMFICHTDSRQ